MLEAATSLLPQDGKVWQSASGVLWLQLRKHSYFGQKTKLFLDNLLSKVKLEWKRIPVDFQVSEARVERQAPRD